jgi:apolipoprotein N-acyltransferase
MTRRALAPLFAGLCIAASMPPWGWWPLAFVGLGVYGSIAKKRRGTQDFLTGFLFAIAWFLPAMAWMWFLTAPGYLIATVLFASLHGLASLSAARLGTTSQRHIASLIVCHGLAEALRLSWPFGGVPLATLAISQASSPLAGLAPYGGVIGLGVVVLWLSMTQRKFRALLIVVVLLGVANRWDGTSATTQTATLAFVQGGGPQGTRAINTNPRDVFDVHLEATQTLQPSTARTAVIWPENVINVTSSGLFIDSEEYTLITAQARRLQVPFVVGITESSGPEQFTNAQIVVEPDGTISNRYDKVRRVPFGEYMPMRPLLQAVGAPTHLVPRDARPGDARGWLDVDNQRVAVAISWEIFFGGRVNEGIVDGAGYIINPTNGSSYTWTILQTQQVASSQLRAREQGRWLVQISPTGFSAFVSPNGEVFDRTGISSQHVVERTIELRQGRTLYSRLGNGPYIWGLLIALAWLANKRTRAIRWRSS